MNPKCVNHPDRESIAPCHSCGQNFCADCLNVGLEFYFCNQGDCRKYFESESQKIKAFDEKKQNFIRQKWEESSQYFYKERFPKLSLIIWIGMMIFSWLCDPSDATRGIFMTPLFGVAASVPFLMLIWVIRITLYKFYVYGKWKKEFKRESPPEIS